MSNHWVDLLFLLARQGYFPPPVQEVLEKAERFLPDLASQEKTEELRVQVTERYGLPSQAVGEQRPQFQHPLAAGQSFSVEFERPSQETLTTLSKTIERHLTLAAQLKEPLRSTVLWRLLPDTFCRVCPQWRYWPVGPHNNVSVWNYLDSIAALAECSEAQHPPGLFSFSIGPVQSFIAAARSVRDLWSGSMTLSWLIFEAMKPILESYGPTALVYPALRHSPFLDRWLNSQPGITLDEHVLQPQSETQADKSPCLPNLFLAIVPWQALHQEPENANDALAESCRQQARSAWQAIGDQVRNKISPRCKLLDPNWADRWTQQMETFFEFSISTVPYTQESVDCATKLGSEDLQEIGKASSWPWVADLAARVRAARRMVRHRPADTPRQDRVPPKCSLLGTLEQMGPSPLRESDAFWQKLAQTFMPVDSDQEDNEQRRRQRRGRTIGGALLRPRERFCAISLAKRFAWPAFFQQRLQTETKDSQEGNARGNRFRFLDTASVAAWHYLEQAKEQIGEERMPQFEDGSASGQWLHWKSRQDDPEEPSVPQDDWDWILAARKKLGFPPTYYAVLMIDGDRMGQKLRQLSLPQHTAVSQVIANFALFRVAEIVQKHFGTLIYAGGDDVLALLPVNQVLSCASKLRREFSGDDDGLSEHLPSGCQLMMMGPDVSSSAGVAVVHYKEDLRFALTQTRLAEKQAKNSGRDQLQLTVCRRSGEHTSVNCDWPQVDSLLGWLVTQFEQQASDRWTYQLRALAPNLRRLELDALRGEIRRQIQRSDDKTRGLISAERVTEELGKYWGWRQELFPTANKDQFRGLVFEDFVSLCQSASFLARGTQA